MASNSKDYYKMRYGQMGVDPTSYGLEEQSIFDAMAMDYGAPFESTAVSRKQVREENEKGTTITETETDEDGSSRQFKSFFPTYEETGGIGVSPEQPENLSDAVSNWNSSGIQDVKNYVSPATFEVDIRDEDMMRKFNNATQYSPSSFKNLPDLSNIESLTNNGALGSTYNVNKAENAFQGMDEPSFFETAAGYWNSAEDYLQELARKSRERQDSRRQLNKWEEISEMTEQFPEEDDMSGSFWRIPGITQGGGRQTLIEAGEVNKDADLSIYGWRPGFEEDEKDTVAKNQIKDTSGVDWVDTSYFRAGNEPVGSGIPAKSGEELAEELFQLENPKTWTPEVIDKLTSKEAAKENGVTLEGSAAAKEALELLRDELKELKDSPEAKQEAYMDFLRENGALKEWRPDLYKGLIGAAFGMLMGADIDDAFYNSFGAIQEAKMLEEERAHELEVQEAKDAGKAGTSLYSTTATKFNVGTDAKPLMVTGVQIKEGVTGLEDKAGQWLITYPDGKKVIMERNALRGDGSLKPFLQPWYTQTESRDIVRGNMNDIIELTKGVITRFQGEHDDKDAMKALDANLLAQAELIPKMVEAHQHQGVSFGPQMAETTRGFVTNVIKDYLEYKYVKEDGRKTLGNFWDDAMLRADMSKTIPDEAWQWYENYTPKVKNPKNETEESGKQPEKFYTEAISGVYKYMRVLEDSGLEGMDLVQTNSDKFKLAWGMFQKWQEDTDKKKVDAKHDVAWEQGYTPFVYWLITDASK